MVHNGLQWFPKSLKVVIKINKIKTKNKERKSTRRKSLTSSSLQIKKSSGCDFSSSNFTFFCSLFAKYSNKKNIIKQEKK